MRVLNGLVILIFLADLMRLSLETFFVIRVVLKFVEL